MINDDTTWTFWLADADRSTGWTNHGYVLQYVTTGYGATPFKAWCEAKEKGRVPADFCLPDVLTALPAGVGSSLTVD